MKRKILRMLTLALSCVMLFTITASAFSTSTRASAYFSFTDVWATPTGSGNFAVEFEVNATKIMKEVGMTKIVIYERQSDGTYDDVKTFTRYNTSGLIATNNSFAGGTVYYKGKSGTKYYAMAVFYAKDSNGSEELYDETAVFTA